MGSGGLRLVAGLGMLLAALPADALEGRYQGSVTRVEGTGGGDAMRHQYDIGGRQTLPRGLDLQVRGVLTFQSRLPVRDTDLLRGRLLVDLRAQRWRADLQYSPWQRNVITSLHSRERRSLLGLHWTPPRGPLVDANYERLDREIGGVRSSTDDSRVRVGWERNGYGGSTGVRRIDSRAAAGLAAPQRTDQWDGALHAERAWGKVSARTDYDALVSQYRMRDLRRTNDTQRVQGQATWTPHPRVTATGTVVERWGHVTETGNLGSRRNGEHDVTAMVALRPAAGLNVQVVREYNRQVNPGADLVADHLQAVTTYRHQVWRQVMLQSGWTTALQFAGANQEAPRNSAFVYLDGRLRRGLEARTELRGARVHQAGDAGTEWHQSAEARTRPTRSTRIDAVWSRDTRPGLLGFPAQTERQWRLAGAFEPSPSFSANSTVRWQTGDGLVHRDEHSTVMTINWRPAPRVTVAANGEWRNSRTANAVGWGRSGGLEVGMNLASGTRVRLSAREARLQFGGRQRSYGLLVERTF